MPIPPKPGQGGNCGGIDQPPCPPQPAATTYTIEEVRLYGQEAYRKGLVDAVKPMSAPQKDDL